MITTYTDLQTRIMNDLQKHHRFGEWSAKHGINQDFRCAYCDRDFLASFDNYDSWQFDHIIPSSRDGNHAYENIVVCCKTCNFLKREAV